MSQRLFGKAKARRALGVDNTADALAVNSETIDDDLTIKGLVAHGLAALAISALGLAVAGSVALTASAQAVEVTQTSTAVQGSADQSQAVPDEQSKRIAEEQAAANEQRNAEEQAATEGQLDAFGRTAASTSRNAVRNEIDRAVADQQAKQRGATLTETGEKAIETSGAALTDARSTNLQNTAAATKREQARLAEEKRKAEEALARQAAEAQAGTLQGQVPDAAPAPAPAPEQGPIGDTSAVGVSGSAATPLPPGRYRVGARWGAVGSWSRYHTGQDLGAAIGTPIRAAADGVVVSPNAGGWAGVHVIIRHANGYTLYAHMSGATVRPGQTVTAGQTIGAVGMTGRTFGPHLHFEYYPVGASTSNPYSSSDPYRWLLSMGVRM
ncbi:peptidoglycan DD-metalloendopeptidase family protein [Ammonicoccus fulvus]|uniref:Peptidoglycan DD-metalloendopeptidase family protein n=1 Tax=Ammonicoccus fulvus TaxID=3138240 RepID=A0ABZ3FVF8_9ACTN